MERGRKIFIIEDDVSIFDVMQIILETEYYVVFKINEKKDIIEQIASLQPDLILMDIHYRDFDVTKNIKKLRKKKKTTKIPIIIASADMDLEKTASKTQVEGYLRKPFGIEELLKVVRNNLK